MSKLISLAAASCLAISGCAAPMVPTAEVMTVQLTGLGLTEQRLAVVLCVTNPNADAFIFRQVTVNLDLAGSPFATGSTDALVRLASRTSTVVPATVLTTVVNIPGQLVEIAKTRGVSYRIHGSVSLDNAFGLRVPYSRSGRLDLTGALELASSNEDAAPARCAQSII